MYVCIGELYRNSVRDRDQNWFLMKQETKSYSIAAQTTGHADK